jgi:hypothetical protein
LKNKILHIVCSVAATIVLSNSYCLAQKEDRDIIQFSGVVVTEDSTLGIPGVHLYVPKGGRGTSTNPYGYFSFPLLEGDSVMITAVGFKRKHIIIPDLEQDNYTIIIPLEDDTTYLENVNIMPFPTEQMFKEAVLAMNLPNQRDIANMDQNLDPALLAQIYRNMGMDGSMNHRFFTQTQAEYLFDAYGPRPNPLLNPFAWAEFFKSLKKKKK